MRRHAGPRPAGQLDLSVRRDGRRLEAGCHAGHPGQDLLASTGRQIRLGRLLGRNQPPEYLHHPLVLKDDGEKLSKAGGDTGIRELRAAGAPPGEVLGRALSLGGLGGARSVEATALADLVGERLLGGSW